MDATSMPAHVRRARYVFTGHHLVPATGPRSRQPGGLSLVRGTQIPGFASPPRDGFALDDPLDLEANLASWRGPYVHRGGQDRRQQVPMPLSGSTSCLRTPAAARREQVVAVRRACRSAQGPQGPRRGRQEQADASPRRS
jgi:hypothetical protein